MSEDVLKSLLEKIQNGENVDISLFTDEQKKFIKQFIDNITKAVEEIASFLIDNLFPVIKEASEIISLKVGKLVKDFQKKRYNKRLLESKKIKPLYLDKRSKIHRCRNNC